MADDNGLAKRAIAYAEAFQRMDESEKLFESKIEEYLTSPEGGWVKATDAGYRNHDYRGMALDIVKLRPSFKHLIVQ